MNNIIKKNLGATFAIQLAIVAAIVVVGLGSATLIYKLFHRGGITYQSSVLLEYKPADKLFTTFIYLPYIQTKTGHLKREFLVSENEKQDVIKGYCQLNYMLGIGYDNVQDLITKFQKGACHSNLVNDLPEPVILSANAESSQVFGDFDIATCDAVDKDKKKREKDFITYMGKFEQWGPPAKKSKEILAGFIRLYCFN